MSIYATRRIIDEDTGEEILVKHLNKTRVDRRGLFKSPGKHGKNGRKARMKKFWPSLEKKLQKAPILRAKCEEIE